MHLDYQYYAGDSHQFWVGIAHGLTLLASSLAPCWGDRESWDEWLLMELRHRYLALCGLAVHLHAVHSSIGDLAGRALGFHLALPCCPATLPTSFILNPFCKLTWLVLGGDPAARSHRVEQFTALGGGSQSIWISGLGNEVDGGLMARVSKVPFM